MIARANKLNDVTHCLNDPNFTNPLVLETFVGSFKLIF